VDIRTQEEQIRTSLKRERLFARLAVLVGGVTLLLVAIGVYGLLAYSVTRRTAEIGIRMALGTRRERVRWMILRRALLLTAMGVAIGIPRPLSPARRRSRRSSSGCRRAIRCRS